MTDSAAFSVERLEWEDEELGTIALPKRPMHVRAGFGSGLSVRAGDGPGLVWAVGDRGPNLKIKTAVRLYGLEKLKDFEGADGAKVMPRIDLGPGLAQLRVGRDKVELVRVLRIGDARGSPVSGLPPESDHAECEPAIDLDGNLLPPDPSGLDTEGIVALADGGFWLGDEFGPSLVRVDGAGRVLRRLTPEGVALEGADYPIEACLPAVAARRQLNRGFEALALSPDEQWLFLAFQSPLAFPDEKAHEGARHVRLWQLDATTGEVSAQYLYALDPPETFLRDSADDEVKRSDIKVSELVAAGPDSLLVLERVSKTTKIYRVTLSEDRAIPPEHLDIKTRPTIEEMSGQGALPLPALDKRLIFSTDEASEVAPDLEGMVILSPSELLLVNDNDFGVEGAKTSFWRIRFDRPLFG